MASAAVRAQGTLLQVGDGQATESFTTVAEVTNIDNTLTSDELDVTSHDSPNRWREFIQGLRNGELTMDLQFVPSHATQGTNPATGLIGLFMAGTRRNFKLVFPTSPAFTMSFAAFVREFSPSAPTESQLTAASTLRLSGLPTFA